MPDPASLLPAFGLGAALGAAFVAGLAWTVRRGLRAGAGVGWYLASFVARLAAVGLVLAAAAGGDPAALAAAGLGFLVARPLAVRASAGAGGHARHP